MGLFDAIASAASGFRSLPSGGQGVADAAQRPPDAVAAAAPPAPSPGADTPPAVAVGALSGRLRTQVGDIAARQGGAAVRDAYLRDVGALFASAGGGAPDLGSAYDAFVQAWRGLAADPQNPAGQRAVVNQGDVLATTVRGLAGGVEQLSGRLGDAVAAGVADLNAALDAINQENRAIVSQAALKRPTGEAEARRDALVAKVVDLTGAQVFSRENKGIALFTAGGQPLLDHRPTCFTSAASPQPAPAGAVDADGRVTDGRLGALLRLAADGSRRNPPQRPDGDSGAEVVRKLRSQLDVVAGTLLGRTRANQPASFADAYDSTMASAPSDLVSGFFVGANRLDVAVNPELLDGSRTVKGVAARAVTASLTAGGRQFAGDAVTVSGASSPAFAALVAGFWSHTADAAHRDSQAADAAKGLMADAATGPAADAGGGAGVIDLQAEVGKLQTLQIAFGATGRIAHSLDEFLGVLDQVAA